MESISCVRLRRRLDYYHALLHAVPNAYWFITTMKTVKDIARTLNTLAFSKLSYIKPFIVVEIFFKKNKFGK